MPRLIVTKGADEGKQFELTTDQLSVGRDASNRIRLHDTEVSRRHAEFVRTAEGYRVVDVGSANGTFVNNRAIRDVLLQTGDQIQVGQSILVYSAGRGAAPAAGDLAERISMITRPEMELSSAIIKTIGETEGSRILTRPEKSDVPFLRANLGIIYEAIQAVSHILDLNQLLDRILELIFRALDADRACILLRDSPPPEATPHGAREEPPRSEQFEPKAVRWRDGANRQEKIPVSRTIMDLVLNQKQGMLVSDAARDDRFHAVQSIVRYGIREIICVPMRGRHETLGILYLDSLTPAATRSPASSPSASSTPITWPWPSPWPTRPPWPSRKPLLPGPAPGRTPGRRRPDRRRPVAPHQEHPPGAQERRRDRHHGLPRQGPHPPATRLAHRRKKPGQDLRPGRRYAQLFQGARAEHRGHRPQRRGPRRRRAAGARAGDLQVGLVAELAEDLPICPADREGIHRSLLNIVGNALDAVEGAETPTVTVSTALEEDGQWAQVRVTDNGSGVAPEKAADIFRPFVSSKGARGTGLGLAVSRKILREHGGDILLESEVGQGSTFILRLPLRRRKPRTSTARGTGHMPLPPPE